MNANQVFYWRELYDAGRLMCKAPSPVVDMEPARVCLPPVTVEREQPQELVVGCKPDQRTSICSSEGSIDLTLPRAQVRIAGVVDAGTLRTVLRCLLA